MMAFTVLTVFIIISEPIHDLVSFGWLKLPRNRLFAL